MRNLAVWTGRNVAKIYAMLPPLEQDGYIAHFVKVYNSKADSAIILTPCTSGGVALSDSEAVQVYCLNSPSVDHAFKSIGYDVVTDTPLPPRTTVESLVKAGGGTLDANTLKPVRLTSGYMVSLKGYEFTAPDYMIDAVRTMLVSTSAYARVHDAFVGLWVAFNMVYVDVSINVQDLESALAMARTNEQIAIWDIRSNGPIYMNSAQ